MRKRATQLAFKCCIYVHSKKCWVVSTQIWVKYGQTQMLGKNVI